jgi:hypothetical protein
MGVQAAERATSHQIATTSKKQVIGYWDWLQVI